MGVKGWRGMLAPLGVSTGDGRRFLADGMRARELPLPLKWQRKDANGHDDSVVIGSLEQINYGTVTEAITNGWINPEVIESSQFPDDLMAAWGAGAIFSDAPEQLPRLREDVAEATYLLEKKVIGPSVDVDECDAAIAKVGEDEPLSEEQLDELFWSDGGEDVELELLITSAQIAAATLVGIPAFKHCRPFELLDDTVALTAAVRSSGWSDLPLAARDLAWDGPAADKRIAEQAGIGGDSPDWVSYAEAFLYQDDEMDPETKGAYGFQIVDLVDGTRMIVPRAVFAVAAVLQGARGGTVIPEADQESMKTVVTGLYDRMREEFEDNTISAPWVEEAAALLVTLTAAAPTYDTRLFDDPKLERITPITITDEGEVYGHIATHDTCHVGIPGQCVTAPFSGREYSDFHRYAVPTTSGTMIEVGRITTGLGQYVCSCRRCRGSNDDHACLGLNAAGTIAHHDKLSTVAWVRAGEDLDNNAIWIHGVLNPAASVDDIASLAQARVSGDWRPIAGRSELVEVLSLAKERAGFPLPRLRMQAGRVSVLTAAGVVRPVEDTPSAEIDYERLGRIVAENLAARIAVPTVADAAAEAASTEVAEVIPEVSPAAEVDELAALLDDVQAATAEADAARVSALMGEIGRI